MRNHLFLRTFLAALLAAASAASAQSIDTANYADPVYRYGHFALGEPHEYARLQVTSDSGQHFDLTLPEEEVFEDIAPRIVQLTSAEAPALLTIISHRNAGSRLALIRLTDGALQISAQSTSIGSPNRWLNPVGVADLDGDGRAEIAAVITPHIGGTLKVYAERGDALVEIAALAGFSNHVYRSPILGLSTPLALKSHMRLLVPDNTRTHLRIIALDGAYLRELGRCPLAEAITGLMAVTAPGKVSIQSASGEQVIAPGECLR